MNNKQIRKFQKKRIRTVLAIVAVFLFFNFAVCVKAMIFDVESVTALSGQYTKKTLTLCPRGTIRDINGIPFTNRASASEELNGITVPTGRSKVARVIIGSLLYNELSTGENAIKGADGIEYTYDSVLNGGSPSAIYASVDANGDIIEEYGYYVASDHINEGGEVVLTLDYNLQKSFEAVCNDYFAAGNSKGIAVVLSEVGTSRISAMVSVGSEMNKALLSYQPGSIMKILTAAAAMECGLSDTNSPYECKGEVSVGNEKRFCSGGEVHGKLDLSHAFGVSCNCCFYELGQKLCYTSENGLMKSHMLELAKKWGFGSYPNKPEMRFFLEYDDHYSFVPDCIYNEMDLFNVTLGEGNVQASPYLINLITNAIASGGSCVKTHLIQSVSDAAGNQLEQEDKEIYSLGLSEKTAEGLKTLMRQTGISGYASDNEITGGVAGKTGTSESVENADYHAWFTGYFPANEPKYALTVFIEEGGYSSNAFELFKRLAGKTEAVYENL